MSILLLHHFLFPSFLNPKTTKIQEFGQNKTPPFAKESSKCYQCLSGFKYCSSPEISSSALVIQDQGALAFDLCSWESSSRSKPKSMKGDVHWLLIKEPSSGRLLWKSDSVGQNFDHWLSVSSWGHLYFSIVSALNSCFGQFIQPHGFNLNEYFYDWKKIRKNFISLGF